jgi:hypothetical protein
MFFPSTRGVLCDPPSFYDELYKAEYRSRIFSNTERHFEGSPGTEDVLHRVQKIHGGDEYLDSLAAHALSSGYDPVNLRAN